MARNGKDKLHDGISSENAGGFSAPQAVDLSSALVELAFEPIFAWDWEKGIIEWNAGAERQYGFTRAEVLGKSSHELLASKHPVSLRRFLKKLESDRHWIGEIRHTTKDGRELIVESRQQLLAQNGRRIVVESNRDITERRTGEGQVALLIIIGELIRKLNDPEELLFAASKAVGEYFKARRCLFNEIDLDNDLEVIHRDYCDGVKSVAGEHKLSSYSPITTAEMAAGRTISNFDSQADVRTAEFYETTYKAAGERSYVAVPLMREGKWKASLWLSDDQPRIWSAAEINLLETIGERVWFAVEKWRSDKALGDSERQFRAVFNQTTGGIAQTDLAGRFLLVNDRYCEIVGRSCEELMTLRLQDITHPEDLPATSKFFQELAAGGPNYVIEKRYVRPDGSEAWVHNDVSSIRDAAGNVVYAVAAVADITQRKKMEIALSESEESYRILAASAADAILRIDEESVIQFVNHAATRIFGYSREEMTGQPLTMLMPEEMRPEHRAGFVRYLRTGVKHLNWDSVHVPARHNDGHHFPLEISFGEYHRDEKRFFIGVGRDITERKRSEERISGQNRILEALAQGKELTDILDLVAQTIERTLPGARCSVLLADADAAHLFGASARALPAEYNAAIEGIPIGEGIGSCGTAAFRRQPVIVADISGDPLWKDFRDLAAMHDLAACWSHPILDPDGTLLGTFATYFSEPSTPTDDDLTILESAARVAGIAIYRRRTENSLRQRVIESERAKDALHESEARRRLAQEAGNVGIFDWDIKNDRTYWSETMWSIYGADDPDINPDETFWSSHLHDSDRERVKNKIRSVVRSDGDEFRDEFRIILPDGSVRWIEARGAISRDPAGVATRMYGVNLDITSRKEAEEQLRLSDNQLRLVTNAVPALISYVDKDLCYRFANQRFTDWFGVPSDEIIGKTPRDVLGSDAFAVLKPHIDEALSGHVCRFETVVPYKVIGERYVHISYIPDIGADGTVYGYYGLTTDLTDLKHSEKLLRSSEERLGLMMESMIDYGIVSTDGNGFINGWNKGAELIFGYPQDEIVGRTCAVLFTPEDVAKAIPDAEMEIVRRENRSADERWMLRKDGARFFADCLMMPLHTGGAISGFVKIISDLTDKQRHAEELQRAHDELEAKVNERTRELAESNAALVQEIQEGEIAEKQRIELLGRLVSSQEFERRRIARDLHDQMGQRLTALRLKIASLHEMSPESVQYKPRIERIQEIAERLDAEVSFITWELRPTTLDDLGLLDAVAAYVEEWSRHYEIAADFHSGGLPKERLDREIETHLYRISQESLNNIAKHAEAKNVTVQLEKRNDSIMLIIEDDGKGFDTARKQSSRDSGKGLGLIGMSERANLIGGEVQIESAPGKGTTIYVRVPLSH